jgi:hypothetical protein
MSYLLKEKKLTPVVRKWLREEIIAHRKRFHQGRDPLVARQIIYDLGVQEAERLAIRKHNAIIKQREYSYHSYWKQYGVLADPLSKLKKMTVSINNALKKEIKGE